MRQNTADKTKVGNDKKNASCCYSLLYDKKALSFELIKTKNGQSCIKEQGINIFSHSTYAF